MLKTVTVRIIMAMPPEAVWSAIAGIGGLERWFPSSRYLGSEASSLAAEAL
ncbi:hypothetical protein [Methylomonas fluvii]|uniref:SRPBCC family protein n=1 Tax=Methylomonas fluvii TaxID=1854564 RepID=A0ABR9DFQ8_9GAMM|nr:hypothetical protein [Methylomonas fluvii]MBD9361686.1 hypothetical protein [Methylomonas fluvii]